MAVEGLLLARGAVIGTSSVSANSSEALSMSSSCPLFAFIHAIILGTGLAVPVLGASSRPGSNIMVFWRKKLSEVH